MNSTILTQNTMKYLEKLAVRLVRIGTKEGQFDCLLLIDDLVYVRMSRASTDDTPVILAFIRELPEEISDNLRVYGHYINTLCLEHSYVVMKQDDHLVYKKDGSLHTLALPKPIENLTENDPEALLRIVSGVELQGGRVMNFNLG